MLYLLAAIGVVTITIGLWRLLAAGQVSAGTRRRVIGPDDDVDFLRRLDEHKHRPDDIGD